MIAVNNVLHNLIGYTHGMCDRLEEQLNAGPEQLVLLLRAWREDVPSNYGDAIE